MTTTIAIDTDASSRDEAGRPPVEDLADRLVRDIQAGRFPPGSWLKQVDLQQRYGCTRVDVRRVLDRLAQKRLVEHVRNRGYYVYADDARAEEIRELRLVLETGFADAIVARASREDLGRLGALAGEFERLVSTGTLLEQYEANLAFHQALLGLSGSRELVALIDDLRCRTSSAPVSQWLTRERVEQSSREHFEMIEALAARDPARLREVMTAHIRQSWRPK
jgi:DNA-binding GntR family transcriptional regulator